MVRKALTTFLAVFCLGVSTGPEAQADRIRLRGGGEIRGHVLPPDIAAPEQIRIQTGALEKPLTLERTRVQEVIPENDSFDAYYSRLPLVRETAEAQFEFGLWCEQNHLPALAEAHYRRAVALDKDFAPAHKKLGHVQHDGRWMTYAELRRAQGMVLYKGKWVSTEEQDRLEGRAEQKAEQAGWMRQIQVLCQNLASSVPEQAAEAERQLREIRDPAALPALAQALGKDSAPHRMLLSQVVGGIPGAEARTDLIRQLLLEDSEEVRRTILTELARRAEPETAAELLKSLRSKNALLVGRVARALAELRVLEAVPQLVTLLVRTETRSILYPNAGAAAAAGGGISVTALSGVSIPILTGPAVAPGAVAYGATSIPFGTGTSLALGSGPGYNMPGIRIVTFVQRNPEVLAALESLTGQNFGYDQATWRQWIRTSFRAEPEPVRRVPQP